MENKLYICAIMRDEHDYIREWVEHHIECGVSHFYLYDNESSRGYEKEIGDYIEKGFITIINWPDKKHEIKSGVNNKQIDAYNNFINSRVWANNEWCAFIDLDEFKGIAEKLEELYGETYTPEYISTLYNKKIPKLIAEKAEEDILNHHFIEKEKG